MAVLNPIREKAKDLREHPAVVEDALAKGAAECSEIAGRTMKEVRSIVGLRPASAPH